jgi:proteasome lid subunit RPN8/RPN11
VVALPLGLYDELVAFGLDNVPNECCGIGLGPVGEVAEFHRLKNVHETPQTRYEISAADQLRMFHRAEEMGWEITMVFHTHPLTEPFPSATDIALAGWPDAVYVILGCGTMPPVMRAYFIRDGIVEETIAPAAHAIEIPSSAPPTTSQV